MLGGMSVIVMIGGMFARVVSVMMMMMSVVIGPNMFLVVIMRMVGSACVLMIGSDCHRLAGLQIKQCCFAILTSAIRAH
jgi:hypothetical protein